MSSFEWGHELPKLSGRNLDLRWLTPEDAPAIRAIFGDPEVMKFWSSPPLQDLAAAEGLIANVHQLFESRTLFQWGVCSRETDEVIGTCTLLNLDQPHRRAEVGIALGRNAWGRGLAAEALQVLIDFAFDTLDLHRLEADIDPENERALRLFERRGFKREGYLRERWHHLGKIHDGVFLGLLRPERSRSTAISSERTGQMPYDEGLAQRIREALEDRSDVSERKMFGGLAFLLGGNMCVGVVKDELMVRVGPDAHDEAMRQPHARAMDFTGRPMRGFVYVALKGFETDTDLNGWVERGVRFAGSLPAK